MADLTASVPYLVLDVFTDTPLEGNPLGVVLDDAEQLDGALMQRVARELNLSETIFLLPPTRDDGDARARIFTPTRELPFAGHPTVGGAIALHLVRRVALGPTGGRVTLEEGVGPVAVEVTLEVGRPPFATLTAAAPPQRSEPTAPPAAVARALSLEPDAVLDGDRAPAVWSCGVPFLCVGLRSREDLSRCVVDRREWAESITPLEVAGIEAVFVARHWGRGDGEPDVHVRQFALGAGVDEDPATGSAAVALAGWLARSAPDGEATWRLSQGVDMGRPSRLDLAARVRDGAALDARVGGHAVLVAEGTLHLPTPSRA